MAPQPVRARDLPPGYTEWSAPAGLRQAIACLWAQVTPDGGQDRDGLVLPDACSDLIWEQGRGAFVAGALARQRGSAAAEHGRPL